MGGCFSGKNYVLTPQVPFFAEISRTNQLWRLAHSVTPLSVLTAHCSLHHTLTSLIPCNYCCHGPCSCAGSCPHTHLVLTILTHIFMRPHRQPLSTANLSSIQDDNDDYCSSCGGNGDLICCDGCPRSFHMTCLDPPLNKYAMPVEWFCNVCRTERNPPSFPDRRHPFGELLARLDGKNSSAFRLPTDIINHFEGVRANGDGEYEEIVAPVKPGR